jgi:hypothetical protein
MGFYRSLRRKAETWHTLSKSDRALLINALFLLPVVATNLKTVGLRRTQSWMAGNPIATTSSSIEQARANVRRTAQMVAAACRQLPLRSRCLPRTIVLWSLLRRRDIDADVRIGVRSDTQGEFQAHALARMERRSNKRRRRCGQSISSFKRAGFDRVKLQSPSERESRCREYVIARGPV